MFLFSEQKSDQYEAQDSTQMIKCAKIEGYSSIRIRAFVLSSFLYVDLWIFAAGIKFVKVKFRVPSASVLQSSPIFSSLVFIFMRAIDNQTSESSKV
jgi:hypothetical protein